MICVVQRVRSAKVFIDAEIVGTIGASLLAFVAVVPDDDRPDVKYIADRLQNLRIFADDAGRMNLSIQDAAGSLPTCLAVHLGGRRPARRCACEIEPEGGR